MTITIRLISSLVCLGLITATATSGDTITRAAGSPSQADAVLLDVPVAKQPYLLCLAASVSMVLAYWGTNVPTDTIAAAVPVYKDGTIGQDYITVIESLGYQAFLIQPPFEDLLTHLARGRPLVVTVPERGTSRHAMVLVGYDPNGRTVTVNDPATGARETQPMETFRRKWERGRSWTLLIVPRA